MGTETWIISLPLSDSILYLKIIHPPNFREEPNSLAKASTFLFRRYFVESRFAKILNSVSANRDPSFHAYMYGQVVYSRER